MLATEEEVLSGENLIHLLLQADVDLLWNGGIGTYLKSADETHVDVSDKANDGVRVDASELGAKVIGEGGTSELPNPVGWRSTLRVDVPIPMLWTMLGE